LKIRLYLDEDAMAGAVTSGLRLRGIDVIKPARTNSRLLHRSIGIWKDNAAAQRERVSIISGKHGLCWPVFFQINESTGATSPPGKSLTSSARVRSAAAPVSACARISLRVCTRPSLRRGDVQVRPDEMKSFQVVVWLRWGACAMPFAADCRIN
jgi:hypothetical protein